MKKKLLYLLLLCIVFCMLFPTYLYAHPGRTDSKGGHVNTETGEYHYHHGYSEHQHIDGVCPYDFADNTNIDISPSNSTSIKDKTSSRKIYISELYSVPRNKSVPQNKESVSIIEKVFSLIKGADSELLYVILFYGLLFLIYWVCEGIKNFIQSMKQPEFRKKVVKVILVILIIIYVFVFLKFIKQQRNF